MWCYLPSEHCALNVQETRDFRLYKALNRPTKIMLFHTLSSPFPSLLNSPHSNNLPPLSCKTVVPLENSITRLHKRFKIIVPSLCGDRERTWPPLKSELTLRIRERDVVLLHIEAVPKAKGAIVPAKKRSKGPESEAKGRTQTEGGRRHSV